MRTDSTAKYPSRGNIDEELSMPIALKRTVHPKLKLAEKFLTLRTSEM